MGMLTSSPLMSITVFLLVLFAIPGRHENGSRKDSQVTDCRSPCEVQPGRAVPPGPIIRKDAETQAGEINQDIQQQAHMLRGSHRRTTASSRL